MKCANFEKLVLKFPKEEEDLNKIVGIAKASLNKEGIGFNPFNKRKCYKNFLLKLTNFKGQTSLTCNYCCKIGHISIHCPMKRKGRNCVEIGVRKYIKPPNVN